MLLSQHDDAGCRADNAHTEQHPRYQHAGLPCVAVAQQALEDHQYQHAEQAHTEYCEHLVAQIISEKTGIPVSELLPDTKRAPVRPVDAKVFLK